MTRTRVGTAILALAASLGVFAALSPAQLSNTKQPATKAPITA